VRKRVEYTHDVESTAQHRGTPAGDHYHNDPGQGLVKLVYPACIAKTDFSHNEVGFSVFPGENVCGS
jgi:hypothetical protein